MENITPEGWGKLRYIRGRDAREKREPTCATGRHRAWRRPSLPALQGVPRCGIDLHKRYRYRNRRGGWLLRAYPNVSRAALHLHSAWLDRPARNCEMSRPRRRRRARFFKGTFQASVKSRNERGLAFDREMDILSIEDVWSLASSNFSLRRILAA